MYVPSLLNLPPTSHPSVTEHRYFFIITYTHYFSLYIAFSQSLKKTEQYNADRRGKSLIIYVILHKFKATLPLTLLL